MAPDLGSSTPRGALVISLDFELRWGARDRGSAAISDATLRATRETIPAILEAFRSHEVAGTWATVGFLFARSRAELEQFAPRLRPVYQDARLDPYGEAVGEAEADDPFHFGSSVVRLLLESSRQEIATHTFSHYYCGESGQTAETFRADLDAALAIAAAQGIRIRSVVFPRNQHNPVYDAILIKGGITSYRGNPLSRMWQFVDARQASRPGKRLARWADSYLNIDGHHSTAWEDVVQPSGLVDVRASRFLRPLSPGIGGRSLRLARIAAGVREAARTGRIYHLWWHPHNFGRHPGLNLAFLDDILAEFGRCRDAFGMESLTMSEVADRTLGQGVRSP